MHMSGRWEWRFQFNHKSYGGYADTQKEAADALARKRDEVKHRHRMVERMMQNEKDIKTICNLFCNNTIAGGAKKTEHDVLSEVADLLI